MGRRERLAFAAFVCAATLVVSQDAQDGLSAQGSQPNIRFRWVLAALPKSGNEATIVRDGAVFRAGDRLKLYLRPLTRIYLYVVHQAPDGTLATLFPPDVQRATNVPDIDYYVPPASGWFELDGNSGEETVHLFAAVDRLRRLEDLLSEYAAAEHARKPAIAANVIAEMRLMRKRYFNARTSPERPIDIGGTSTRGPADLSTLAETIVAQDFYSRTVRIDHR